MKGFDRYTVLETIGTILPILTLPLMLLNTFGGVVGVIWLAFLGEWEAIGTSLLLGIGGIFFLSIILGLLYFVLSPLLILMSKLKNILLQTITASIGGIPTVGVMALWAYICFSVLIDVADSLSFPLLLAAYGSTTTPFVYFAQKDQQTGGNDYSMITLFFFQIASILNLILIGFFNYDIDETLPAFIFVMTLAMITNAIVVFFSSQRTEYPY